MYGQVGFSIQINIDQRIKRHKSNYPVRAIDRLSSLYSYELLNKNIDSGHMLSAFNLYAF